MYRPLNPAVGLCLPSESGAKQQIQQCHGKKLPGQAWKNWIDYRKVKGTGSFEGNCKTKNCRLPFILCDKLPRTVYYFCAIVVGVKGIGIVSDYIN